MAQRTLSSNALKAPVRPAPPPPALANKGGLSAHVAHGTPITSSAPFRPSTEPKKKLAPPRPPPPKASAQLKAVQNAIAFTGMVQLQSKKQNQLPLTSSVPTPDLLINWDSPPGSPTPGRSSSDGLSLKSFGSDSSGTTANGAFSTMTRSESGFESEPDAWSDPIVSSVSMPPVKNEHLKPFNMPTIIRPNRSAGKPPPPAISSSSTHLKVLEKIVPIPVTTTITTAANSRLPQPRSSSPYLADLLDLDLSAEYSPPEPSIPPPAPPSFLLTSSPATESISSPPAAVASYPATLPPPPSFELDLSDVPSAVALFDYHSSHLGDLNFKEGDRIVLLSQVNEEWYRGSIGNSEGMFPTSFVRIVVPLVQLEKSDQSPDRVTPGSYSKAVALYAFRGETDEDLSLLEGDIVQVIESLGNGWLYGEDCRSGRRGQFPESFVRQES